MCLLSLHIQNLDSKNSVTDHVNRWIQVSLPVNHVLKLNYVHNKGQEQKMDLSALNFCYFYTSFPLSGLHYLNTNFIHLRKLEHSSKTCAGKGAFSMDFLLFVKVLGYPPSTV